MRKKSFKLLVMAILVFIGFRIGMIVQRERDLDMVCIFQEDRDSFETLLKYRNESTLPYYNMNKDSVLRNLPKETWRDEVRCIYDGVMITDSHEAYYDTKRKLEGTNDTIYAQEYYWRVSFGEMTDLYIVFELQDDSTWVVKSCKQWNPEKIRM